MTNNPMDKKHIQIMLGGISIGYVALLVFLTLGKSLETPTTLVKDIELFLGCDTLTRFVLSYPLYHSVYNIANLFKLVTPLFTLLSLMLALTAEEITHIFLNSRHFEFSDLMAGGAGITLAWLTHIGVLFLKGLNLHNQSDINM